jgi:hypothetical protein
MKRSLFFLFVITASAQAQVVTIPDEQFKNTLLKYSPAIDTNANGQIEVSEALAVQSLNVAGQNIRDLTGIKSFANLKTLVCNDDRVSNFDVSGMTALEEIQCSSTLGLNYGAYYSLNVSGCTSLITLSSAFNLTTSLNLAGCANLKNLIVNNNTDLTNLDLSACSSLEYLNCSATDLSALDLSKNLALKNLQCSNLNILGYGRLINLDVSRNLNLETLLCTNDRFESLDVSNNTKLKELQCDFNSMKNLNLSNCVNLATVSCSNNLLPALNLSSTNINYSLDCSNNLLTGLDVSTVTSLVRLTCDNNRLTSLAMNTNTNLNFISAKNNLLTSLNLNECPSLTALVCGDNQIASLDFTKNINISAVQCQNNRIASFILSASSNCSGNLLTSLDLSNCTGFLYGVQCQDNKLTYLNIHNGVNENRYGVFDFSNNPKLSFICADDFQLAAVSDSAAAYGLTNVIVTDNCALPLSLVGFTALAKNSSAFLNWQTSSETNTSRFVIQRSLDAKKFTDAGIVSAAGFSSGIKNYQFTDAAVFLPGVPAVYYRLQMIDRDGKFTYSAVKKTVADKNFAIDVYPNPARNMVTVSFSSTQNKSVRFNLYNTVGQLLLSSSAKGFSVKQIDISALSSGLYFLEIITGTETPKKRLLLVDN